MGLTRCRSSMPCGERGAARLVLGIRPWVCRMLQLNPTPPPPPDAVEHRVTCLACRKAETSGAVLLE